MSSLELGDLRFGIETIDEQMIDLIARRFDLARQIEKLKRERGDGIICQCREVEELDKLCGLAISRGVDPDFVRSLLRLIVNESIRAQLAQREAADDR